ncbi:unnamed protein product, partial [Mesorhabditis belari]|uniref:Uncharacterized protein n=1 Tax=Mesorhabditis belari TaxID=2138241 RepID=A0AAF3EB45_9BILA
MKLVINSLNPIVSVGVNNTNFRDCSNYHVNVLFLMDPETPRGAFTPMIQLLVDILYSCQEQALADEGNAAPREYPVNRFTYISVQTMWSCNLTDCDLENSISLDYSRYPASSDVDLFKLIKKAIEFSTTPHDNQVMTFFIISNIKKENFKLYPNITYIMGNPGRIGEAIGSIQAPFRLLWFPGEREYPFGEIQKFSNGWFKDYSIANTDDFPKLIDELYICPVNGTYVTPSHQSTETTTKPHSTDKDLDWVLPMIFVIILFCFGLCLVARWRFCSHWTPKIPFLHDFKMRHGSAHSVALQDQIRAATLQSAAGLAGIGSMASKPRTASGSSNGKDPWEINSDRVFLTHERLGCGASSEVVKALLKGRPPVKDRGAPMQLALSFNDNSNVVAAKYLKPSACLSAKSSFMAESKLLREIGFHPHIVPFVGIVSDGPDRLLLTQLCPFGDLLRFLKNNQGTLKELEEKEKQIIAWQICDALCYLSAKKFIHRDVAARNVFMYGRTIGKLGDFGLCVKAPEGRIRAGGHLPVRTLPPEAIETLVFDEKTDVWAFGLLLWELYTGGLVPLADITLPEVLSSLKSGYRPQVPEKCPEKIVELMTECWQMSPDDRPSFTDLRAALFNVIDLTSAHYGYIHFQDYKRFIFTLSRGISTMPTQLNNENDFKSLTSNDNLSIVHFYASWAPQCQQLNQVLDDLKAEATTTYEVAYIDAEEVPEASLAANVTAAPTTIFYKKGREVARVNGFQPIEIRTQILKFSGSHVASVSAPVKEDLNDRLKRLISTKRLMLFMKGDATTPRCGFSRQTIDLLNGINAEYGTFDILNDEEVRQLYLDGELVGGLDVIREELQDADFVARIPKKETLNNRLKLLINASRLMLFMKGNEETPRCGFSKQIIGLLNDAKVDFRTFDILGDEEVRQGLKEYSNWPTYPQLYLDGELIGGLDVIREELKDNDFVERLPRKA